MAVTTAKVAGMDENRTHQGHLSSALRTVLKTAGLASKDVHQRPRKCNHWHRQSTVDRARPQLSSCAAVILAVTRSRVMANLASPDFVKRSSHSKNTAADPAAVHRSES